VRNFADKNVEFVGSDCLSSPQEQSENLWQWWRSLNDFGVVSGDDLARGLLFGQRI
jgi:hypothetical protein